MDANPILLNESPVPIALPHLPPKADFSRLYDTTPFDRLGVRTGCLWESIGLPFTFKNDAERVRSALKSDDKGACVLSWEWGRVAFTGSWGSGSKFTKKYVNFNIHYLCMCATWQLKPQSGEVTAFCSSKTTLSWREAELQLTMMSSVPVLLEEPVLPTWGAVGQRASHKTNSLKSDYLKRFETKQTFMPGNNYSNARQTKLKLAWFGQASAL